MTRKWALRLAPVLVLLALVGARLPDPAAFDATRVVTFDIWQRVAPRAIGRTDPPVVVVDIDDESLQRHGYWPWSRDTMAQVADRLREGGARVAAFVMVFAEPDPTAPARVLAAWPRTPETDALRGVLGTLPDPDKTFAASLAGLPAAGGFVMTGPNTARAPALMAAIDVSDPGLVAAVPAYRGAVPNLRLIEAATAGNGALSLSSAPGGLVRSVPMVVRLHDQLYPGLAAEALRLALGSDGYVVQGGDAPLSDRKGIVAVATGGIEIPTDRAGRMRLLHARPIEGRVIPAWRLLAGGSADELVRDRIVLVGVSATGFGRIHRTALGNAATDAELLAEAIEQVLDGAFVERPAFALFAELGFLLLFGLAALLAPARLAPAWTVGAAATVVAAALLGSGLAFHFGRWEIDGVYPAAGFLAVFLTAAVARHYRDLDRRALLSEAFGRQVSPAVLDRVVRQGTRLTGKPETRDVTILFSAVRGFEHAAESLAPEALAGFLNEYLTTATGLVHDRNGAVDKYLGDGMMACWNVPFEDPAHAEQACRAAIAMTRRVRGLGERVAAAVNAPLPAFVPLQLSIGISTGACAVGNFGSRQRADYTVLGRDVAMAARLRDLCRHYGADMLLAPGTQARVLGFATLEVDLLRVADRVEPVPVFALLGDEVLAARPGFKVLSENHQAMLDAYRGRQWAAALDAVAACRNVADSGLPGLYDLYAARIRAFQRRPPPEDWDGVSADDTGA